MAKFCKNCGAELLSEDAVVCLNCGAEQNAAPKPQPMLQPQPQEQDQFRTPPPPQAFSQPYMPQYSQQFANPYVPIKKTTSILGWIGWMVLCGVLPLIGPIIMVCVCNDDSAKNYAKATLIFYILAFGIAFVLGLMGVDLLSSLASYS